MLISFVSFDFYVMAIFDGQFSDSIFKLLLNPLLWFVLVVFAVLAIIMFLNLRKKRRLKFRAIEFIEAGNDNINYNILKCGMFGKNSYFRGLWWSGREVMKTEAGEEIIGFSEEDFQVVNGKKAVTFYRHPINRQLIPVNKARIENKEVVAELPPAEYVDAGIDIIRQSIKEASDWRDKLIAYAFLGLMFIVALILIIVIMNGVSSAQDKASKLIVDAGNTCMQNAKEVCQELFNTVRGTSP